MRAGDKLLVRFSTPLLIFLILLFGILFRLWGIDFGLPYLYHPDEPVIIITAQNILRSGDTNPHFYLDPPFFIYLNAFVYIPYLLYTSKVGGITSFSEIISPRILVMGTGYSLQPTTILMDRLLTCIFGIASILLLFFLARRYSRSTTVGLLAAFFLAISPGNIMNSKTITPDAHFVFFMLLTALFSLDIYERGRLRSYLLAGVITGLAAGVKYNGAMIAVLPVAAHFLRCGNRSFRYIHLLVAAGLMSIISFILTNPYAVLDFENFYQGVQFEALHYSSGHAGMEGNTLSFYINNFWREGGLVHALGFIGMIFEVVHKKKGSILMASFPVLFFLFISLYTVRNERTSLPVTPFLILFAATLVVRLWNIRIHDRWKVYCRVILVGLTIGSSFMSISRSFTRCSRLTIVDSRETSRIWIEQNIIVGSKIALEAYSPYVDPDKYHVYPLDRLILHDFSWFEQQDVDFIIASAGMFQRFYNEPDRYADQISQYEQLFSYMELEKTFLDGGYEVRIYHLKKVY